MQYDTLSWCWAKTAGGTSLSGTWSRGETINTLEHVAKLSCFVVRCIKMYFYLWCFQFMMGSLAYNLTVNRWRCGCPDVAIGRWWALWKVGQDERSVGHWGSGFWGAEDRHLFLSSPGSWLTRYSSLLCRVLLPGGAAHQGPKANALHPNLGLETSKLLSWNKYFLFLSYVSQEFCHNRTAG